jgi:putative tryptophan/tyrosine transport system substrate-binding protein
MSRTIRRREFVALLSGAVARPLAARAQQPALPVIGYLSSRSWESDASMLAAFRRGLNESGYFEGMNVTIEHRWAEGQTDRLLALFTDLARRQVGVIVFAGLSYDEALLRVVRASQIPIVFNTAYDPVRLGLVASMNRPGGNITGINTLLGQLTTKHVGLLRELLPDAKTIAVLANSYGAFEQLQSDAREAALTQMDSDAREAADKLGFQLIVLNAATESEIEAAFTEVNAQQADAIAVATAPFSPIRAAQIARLATLHRVPTISARREFAVAGGLMSYGFDIVDSYSLMANYAARILKGVAAGDLPVFQPTKLELVINLRTARALGLTVPTTLLVSVDEVID